MTIKQILTGVRDWINNKFATKASVNTALAAKQDKLVSGTNIKTINKQSLLGSGNITIQGGGGGDADMAAVPGESGYIANKLGGYAIPVEDDDFAVEVSPSITLYQGDYYVAIPDSMVKEWRNGGVIMQLIAAGKSLVAWANPDDENVKGDIWYSPEDAEIQFRVDEPLEDEDLGIFEFEIANLANSEVEFVNKDGEIEIQSAVVVPLPSNATPNMQPKLVSGSNIKTINNTSILGSGNINIDADTTDCVKVVSQSLTAPQKTQARTNVDAVGSQTIENIIELTQAEYDALTTKDPTAIYVVTDTSPSTESQNVGIANIETESSSVSGGTNVTTITLTNGESYDIEIKNGEQGNSGYSGAAGELEVVNNLTDGGATAALSAAQGVVLDEKIVKTGLKNIDLNDYVEITTIAGGSGKWVTDNANYPFKSIFIACSPNDRFIIVSEPTVEVTYCFLTAPNYVNNTDVDYATGYSGNGKKTPAGGGMIVAPSNATYLCILVRNTSGVYIGPTSIGIESNAQSVAEAVASEVGADINSRLDGQEVNITDGKYLNSSGAEVTDTNYAYTDYIPLVQGDMVDWTSGTTSTSVRLVAYDASKSVLGTYTPTKTIRVTNTGAAYIRASYRKGQGITMPVAVNSKKAFTIVATATAGFVGYDEQPNQTTIAKNIARTNIGALSADGVRFSNDYNLSYYDRVFQGTVNTSGAIVSSSRHICYRNVSKGEVYSVIAHNTNATTQTFSLWFAEVRPAMGSTGLVRQLASSTGGNVSDAVVEWVAPKDGWLVVDVPSTTGSYYPLYQRIKLVQLHNYASEQISVPKIESGKAIDANADSPTFGQAISASSTYFGVSDYIDIGDSYCIQAVILYNASGIFQNQSLGGVFYDSNKTPLSVACVHSWTIGNTSGYSMILVPSGAKYVRMTTYDDAKMFAFRELVSDCLSDINDLKQAEFLSRSFSSFIPFRETYENYMPIIDTQGAAIYGDYLVTWMTGNKLNIYDLSAKTLVQQLTLPTFPNTRTHANTLSFGAQKYNEADLFPCLYLCSGYTTTAGSTDSQVYVLRLSGSLGSMSASLVQTITLDMGVWTEFVVDPVKDVAWINGSGVATYICVAVPSVTGGDVTITPSSTIIDQFNVPKIVLGLSTKSSGQGRFFYHSRVYYVSGVPQSPDEGVDALCLVVDNTLTHCTEAIVALKNFGLTDEPEACIVWNNDFYVVYPSFLAKLIQ